MQIQWCEKTNELFGNPMINFFEGQSSIIKNGKPAMWRVIQTIQNDRIFWCEAHDSILHQHPNIMNLMCTTHSEVKQECQRKQDLMDGALTEEAVMDKQLRLKYIAKKLTLYELSTIIQLFEFIAEFHIVSIIYNPNIYKENPLMATHPKASTFYRPSRKKPTKHYIKALADIRFLTIDDITVFEVEKERRSADYQKFKSFIKLETERLNS